MRRTSVGASAVAVALLAASGPVWAKAPVVLTPNGPWNVEYAPDSCALARAFGSPDQPVYLRMEQFEPGPEVEVSLIDSPLKTRQVTENVQVAFGTEPGSGPLTSTALFGKSSTGKPALTFSLSLREVAGGDPNNLADLTAAEAGTLRDLSIALVGENTPIVFKTGKLNEAWAAMNVCMDKLLLDWGTNPAEQRNLKQRAEPLHPDKWFRPVDYPIGAVDAGRSSSIHFRLTVDERGRVAKCSIQHATQGSDLVRRTCAVLGRRARFQPARDANGKAVSSYFVNTIRWIVSKTPREGVRVMTAETFNDLLQ